mmetsp:Transcript_73708/g.208752  ORF Transcript_73708/g.208752 Transcript_73708/m.208752 type:complete len:1462 (+) Transcript_73708:383-4768(+)
MRAGSGRASILTAAKVSDSGPRRAWRVAGLFRGAACPPERVVPAENSKPFPVRRGVEQASMLVPMKPGRIYWPRRRYHACHRRSLSQSLVLCTLNVQMLSFQNLQSRNTLCSIVSLLRNKCVELCMLTDVQPFGGDDEVHYVAVEEFIAVIAGKVAIMMSRPIVNAWRLAGSRVEVDPGGRWVAARLRMHGKEFCVSSAYAPTQSSGGATVKRHEFFKRFEEMVQKVPKGVKFVCGGDFNSHLGPRLDGGSEWQGAHTLPTPTAAKSGDLVTWGLSNCLTHVDSHLACKRRGTWWNGVAKKWYENDVFVSSIAFQRHNWRQLRTVDIFGCDHRGKVVRLCLPSRPRRGGAALAGTVATQGPQQVPRGHFVSGFDGSLKRKNKIRWDQARGPSAAAAQARAEYKGKVEVALGEGDLQDQSTVPADSDALRWPWDRLAGICRGAAEEVCGRQPRTRDCPCAEQNRPAILRGRAQLSESYGRVQAARGTPQEASERTRHKELKRALRTEERRLAKQVVNEVCDRLECAVGNKDYGRLYGCLRELGIYASGFSLQDQCELTPETCRDHFLAIGGTKNEISEDLLERIPLLPVQEEMGLAPDDSEIMESMQRMKESAAGDDEITLSMLLTGGPRLLSKVYTLIRHMWRHPGSWEPSTVRGVLIMLWKRKGSRMDPDKYRGISLLSLISRVIARVAASRLDLYAERAGLIAGCQWGFRRGRGTRDPVLVARVVCELMSEADVKLRERRAVLERQGLEQHDPLWEQLRQQEEALECARVAFILVDIKKAYPSVGREHCWKVLARCGIPAGLIAVLSQLHDTTQFVVRTPLGDSEPFGTARGLREGCPSSCVVYNIYHNCALSALLQHLIGIPILASAVPSLAVSRCCESDLVEMVLKLLCFADDTTAICLVPDAKDTEQALVDILGLHGETVHDGKTERMVTGHVGGYHSKLEPEHLHQELGVVVQSAIRLLGCWIDKDGGSRTDQRKRLQAAGNLWGKIKKQVMHSGLSLRLKGRIVEATVFATLFFGAEVRTFTVEQSREYQRFCDKIARFLVFPETGLALRKMEGNTTMEDVRRILGFRTVEEYALERQLRYLGHLGRYGVDRVETHVLSAFFRDDGLKGTGCKGARPSLRAHYWKLVQEVMRRSDLPPETWHFSWREFASQRHGAAWFAAVDDIRADMRALAGRKCWASLKESGAAATQCEPLPCDLPGCVQCAVCLRVIRTKGFRSHRSACKGTPDSRPLLPQECPRCGKFFRWLRKHSLRCKGRPAPKPVVVQGSVPPVPDPPVVAGPDVRRRLRVKQSLSLSSVPGPVDPASPGSSQPSAAVAASPAPSRPDSSPASSIGVGFRDGRRIRKAQKSNYVPKPAAKPKAPATSTNKCPHCGLTFTSANHTYTCPQAPWDCWVTGVKQRQRQQHKGVDTSQWPFGCRYCGVRYETQKGFSCHLTACEKRRRASGLPVGDACPSG